MQAENVIKEKHAGDIEQLKFIFSDENRIIVTAPAGCGKTTAMVSKIARELSNGHILSNKKILAMTFSVNAAMKIKDSLSILMWRKSAQEARIFLWITTFSIPMKCHWNVATIMK